MSQLNKHAVMRSFFIRNQKVCLTVMYFLIFGYVNNNLPFRIKRIDFNETYLEFFY